MRLRTENSPGVNTLVLVLPDGDVSARLCFGGAFPADLWLKAEMLAGCALCIIDADGGWGLQATGCSFKHPKVE